MFDRVQALTNKHQAGLNLNIFGAVAGAFSGKSKKETAADGSSVEQREEQAHVKGAYAFLPVAKHRLTLFTRSRCR